MKVSELRKELKRFPQDADVKYLYDGKARGHADQVWLAKGGYIVISSEGEYFHDENCNPVEHKKKTFFDLFYFWR